MLETVRGTKSKVNIKGHPVHHLLIPFPIAFFIGALASDAAYTATKDKFWSRASFYLVGGGLATGIAAAGVGMTDFIMIRRARVFPDGWVHMLGNAAVLGLAAASFTMRLVDRDSTVVPKGLAIQSAISALLVATSWYGGELAYRRRIGVIPASEAMMREMGEQAQERAA